MRLFIIFTLYILLSAMPVETVQAQDATTEQQQISGKKAFIEGITAFENENYEQAVELFSFAYTHLPEQGGISLALADAYFQMGDLSNATYYAEQATKLDPVNKWYHLKLVEIYRQAGNISEAINELETILEHHPDDSQVLRQLAEAYASQGEYTASNQIYNRLLKIQGSAVPILIQKLQNFDQLNMKDSVITQLEQIRELDPDNLSTLQVLSDYYLEMGQIEKAKSILEQALQQNSRDPQTLIMLADLYASGAEWKQVGSLLEDVISDPVVEPEAKLTIARYILSQYQQDSSNRLLIDATSNVLQTFIESEPDYARAHALSADFFIETQQIEKALDALKKTTELTPSNGDAWRQRLQILMSDQQYQRVIGLASQADEMVPQDPFILYFWGSAYLAEGQYKQAVEKLAEAADLPARRNFKTVVYTNLGDSYAGLNRWEDAFKAYELALSMDNRNDTALNNYAYYLSLQKRQLDKAENMALEALELSNNQSRGTYLDTVGWIYYQKEEFEKAETYIRKAVEAGETSAEVMEHLGDVYHKLDQHDLAKEWWKKAFQKDNSRTHLKDKITQ